MTTNITDERAARRYHQIAVLERQLTAVNQLIANSKQHTKELQEQADGLTQRMRIAARDEGELPLFDLDGE